MRAAKPLLPLLLLVLLLVPARARASFDEFSDDRAPAHLELQSDRLSLQLKGELKLGLHDIEGSGGPGRDSPTDTRTLGTRSPIVEIDAFWLRLRFGLGSGLGVFSLLDFTSGGEVDSAWLDYRFGSPSLSHHLQLGYQPPIVAIDRRTERYPLTATSYWRESELHLAYELAFAPSDRVVLEAGASLAMMRPLGFAGLQQSQSQAGTINLLASGSAQPFSGNGPVGGGRLKLTAFGVWLEAFGFLGKLAAQGGTDVLRSGFPGYRELPGYSEEDSGSASFGWAGGRIGYTGHGVFALAEVIASREGLLRRVGGYAQLSYRFELSETRDWLRALEPLVRYEVYRLLGSTEPHAGRALRSPAVINAVSWDWDVLTLAVALEAWRDLFFVRLEYFRIDESNGVPALDIPDEPLRNNELLLLAAFRF
ncbi:MAG TPA: hypothetical protein DFS52_21955 [Myxococcales bacterium]|nr:hypothetical protein [Myxococcales bacterium]